jgi:hypothetical protein
LQNENTGTTEGGARGVTQPLGTAEREENCLSNTSDETSATEPKAIFALRATPLPAPTVDEYREYLDEFEITEDQKIELLQTLWWIAVTFADIGWGVDSVQKCIPSLSEFSSAAESDALEGIDTKNEFNGAVSARKDHSP